MTRESAAIAGELVGLGAEALEDQALGEQDDRLGTLQGTKALEDGAHAVDGILRPPADLVDDFGGILLDFALAPLELRRRGGAGALAEEDLARHLRIGVHVDGHRLGDRQVVARLQRFGGADHAQQRLAHLVVIGREVDKLAGTGDGDHRYAIFRSQRVDEFLRAVHRAARRAGADVALIDQQHDEPAGRRPLRIRGREGLVRNFDLVRSADHPQRISRADVFDARDLPPLAVDFDRDL